MMYIRYTFLGRLSLPPEEEVVPLTENECEWLVHAIPVSVQWKVMKSVQSEPLTLCHPQLGSVG